MARCLIVGGGERGRALAAALTDRGQIVRSTSRDPGELPAIEAAGAEAVLADPDRMATLVPALDHVSVLVVLLGTAEGEREQIAALHGPRLAMLLEKLLDTTVRGVVYESAGSVPPEVLEAGAARVAGACRTSRIPYALNPADPDASDWLGSALAAVDGVLGG